MIAHQTAILYLRYSPRPKDTDSIQKQASDLQDWCERNGYRVRLIAFDPDTSGATPIWSRPGLAIAFEQLKRGEAFVVRHVDRAARSLGIGIAIEEHIDQLGATFVSIEQGGRQESKSENWNAWAMRQVMNLMAEGQRVTGNERTSRRMRQKQREGFAMSACPPYGRRRSGDRLEPDEAEQETARRIRSMWSQGKTPGQIAAILDLEGVPCRGSRWHRQTIRRIVHAID
jgi:DNA invertase Pin-like site-specific DNA recombinase